MFEAYLVFVSVVLVVTILVDALPRSRGTPEAEKPKTAKELRYERHWQQVLEYERRNVSE